MHIEFLVEDSSGEILLRTLLPQLLGPQTDPHTWRIHAYKGIGRVPKGMTGAGDPMNRLLLDRLPKLLSGYSKSPGIDAVVVVLDVDKLDYQTVMQELHYVASQTAPLLNAIFRLAVEEIEAWYLGDRAALLKAYPRAKMKVLAGYTQDAACGTWELLADAVHPGGLKAIKKAGWPLPGQIKHEWAEKIGRLMTLDENASPSFREFRDGMRQLAAGGIAAPN